MSPIKGRSQYHNFILYDARLFYFLKLRVNQECGHLKFIPSNGDFNRNSKDKKERERETP